MPERELFILYRGFEAKGYDSNGMMSLKGFLIENEHIHNHTKMLDITTCHITLMMIDHSKLSEMHIKMVHVSLTAILSLGSLILPNSELSFKNCFSELRAEKKPECWVISPQ